MKLDPFYKGERGKRGGKRDADGHRIRGTTKGRETTAEERFVKASTVTYKHANIPSVVGITRSVDPKRLAPELIANAKPLREAVADAVNKYWDSLPKESR